MDHQRRAPATERTTCHKPCLQQGLVTIFTGDGRGKTTAAIGTAVRAAGHGLRVLIVFFMKGPDFVHGEVKALQGVSNITMESFGASGWAMPGQDNAVHRGAAEAAISFAAGAIASGSYDLVVLDEAVSALSFGLLTENALLKLLESRPGGIELLLTGRGASAGLVDKADLVTEMRSIKHPFDLGIAARAGIDY